MHFANRMRDKKHRKQCREQGSTPRPPELNENPSLRIRENNGLVLLQIASTLV